MTLPLLIAAALTALLAVVHSYLGEVYIITRLLRRDNLPKLFGGSEFTKNTLRFAWHITSVMALGFAALLVAYARPEPPSGQTVLRIIAMTNAGCGVVALVGSRGRHLSWIVFFAVAALAWFGA